MIETVREHLGKTIKEIQYPNLETIINGKVRDIFALENGRMLIAVSDRISVFDRVVGTIPFKGQVLNGIANWWFNKTAGIIQNHLFEVPHGQLSVVKRLSPLPVEIIVRGYLTGTSSTSILTAYKRGERLYCGHTLPDGLVDHQKLAVNLVTPSTKGHAGEHDMNISRREIIEGGLVSEEIYDKVERAALALFEAGQLQAASSGLILADTKYEFGLDDEGSLYIIDEIHTPDSSRYWYADDYDDHVKKGKSPRGLDKDTVRHYMQKIGYNGDGPIPPIPDEVRIEASLKYIKLYEILTGTEFTPDLRSIYNINF
ncbi:phosphoribosylaminoimidazolesuccinocarboxamide synthase [Myxococcota bacterium]|nr:phosphoribosylaminoimidazolesuccinocarboxamide synthase [Myxococcota bacterium]MBU1382687.1 phosphoribosylaminoimidazolesuccinocarboxamide synthase [Myxococcota bacterium]MBU1497710.1 phosphoribosylaminoimidazolesuccinocarboxamide synthase [Myxococcota bacterium]